VTIASGSCDGLWGVDTAQWRRRTRGSKAAQLGKVSIMEIAERFLGFLFVSKAMYAMLTPS